MEIILEGKHPDLTRAYIFNFTASNGETYRLVVSKSLGYIIEGDKKNYFEADLENKERSWFWDQAIRLINDKFPEEMRATNGNFNQDLVNAKK